MYKEVPWRLIRSLSNKKERDRTGLTVAEGPSVVLAALERNVKVLAVILSEDFAETLKGRRIREDFARYPEECQLFVVSKEMYRKMSDTKSPQGAMCLLPFPFQFLGGQPPPVWECPLYVIGIDIQDPANVASLIRSGAAAGADSVILTGLSADPFGPKVIRSSAGSIFATEVLFHNDPIGLLEHLRCSGVLLVKALPKGGVTPWECNFTGDSAVLLGNEARGLRPEILDLPGEDVTIPMPGGIESLNVAMAASVLLYEAVRQRTSLNK